MPPLSGERKWRHPGGKLREVGASKLDEAELLAVLISAGVRGRSAESIARDILEKFGSLMDKVNLPIPGEDGPKSYDNSVAHFERIAPKKFLVKLGNSKDLRVWRRKSKEQGMLYKLVGGREFGFYNAQ